MVFPSQWTGHSSTHSQRWQLLAVNQQIFLETKAPCVFKDNCLAEALDLKCLFSKAWANPYNLQIIKYHWTMDIKYYETCWPKMTEGLHLHEGCSIKNNSEIPAPIWSLCIGAQNKISLGAKYFKLSGMRLNMLKHLKYLKHVSGCHILSHLTSWHPHQEPLQDYVGP